MGEDGEMADSYQSDLLANPDPRDDDAQRATNEQNEADIESAESEE